MPGTMMGRVNPPTSNVTDGDLSEPLFGKQREQLGSDLHAPLYTQTYRGNLWSASITTATAIPIFATNATPNFFLLNPHGNTTNVVLVRLNLGFEATNSAAGAIGYSVMGPNPPIGSLVGTAAPISAYTTATIQSGKSGRNYNGNIIAGSAATIGGANVNYRLRQLRWSNLSAGVVIATSTASFWSLSEDFNGTLILEPGTFWCLTASTAVASTFQISALAYETPQ